eukprot:10604890-Alexandrium_andersonii.AAC.1
MQHPAPWRCDLACWVWHATSAVATKQFAVRPAISTIGSAVHTSTFLETTIGLPCQTLSYSDTCAVLPVSYTHLRAHETSAHL